MFRGGGRGGGCCDQVPCPWSGGGRGAGVVTRSHVPGPGGGERGGCCDQVPCPCSGGEGRVL